MRRERKARSSLVARFKLSNGRGGARVEEV